MRYIAIFLALFSASSHGAKLSLLCSAFDYSIESQRNIPLDHGKVRYVGQTLAGFVNSDDYSLTVTTECKGKREETICLNVTDSHYCSKPTVDFKFRQIKNDGSVVMISDRCDGSWTKYQMIGESTASSHTRAYMEDRTFFQLKNQIHSGISIEKDKPVFLLSDEGNGEFVTQLVSFRRELWTINPYDPLRNKLKVSLESYENDPHESISLSSFCRSN
jgi:hypothetical protein